MGADGLIEEFSLISGVGHGSDLHQSLIGKNDKLRVEIVTLGTPFFFFAFSS